MRVPSAIVILFLLASPVFAQFDAGQISGFVRDSTGSVVPNSTVTATNEGSGETHKTTANSEGYYIFPQLYVGKYSITVEQSGF